MTLDCELTAEGHVMADFPLEPQLAKTLMASASLDCAQGMLSLVALLSAVSPFIRPRDAARAADEAKSRFVHPDSDHLTLLNVYNAFKQNRDASGWCHEHFLSFRALKTADSIRANLARTMQRHRLLGGGRAGGRGNTDVALRKALLHGCFTQVAHLESRGGYLTLKDSHVVALHPSAVMAKTRPPRWCLYQEFIQTNKSYMRTCTAVEPDWLLEVAPSYFDPTGPAGANWQDGAAKRALTELVIGKSAALR